MKKRKSKSEKDGGAFHRLMTDPQGSYTGVPEQAREMPVQDADDL